MLTNALPKVLPKKNTSQIGKVCILRLSALGDVCNTCAIVQEIQRQRPDISLTWIIGKKEYSLVKNLRDIEFIVFNKFDGIFAYFELLKQLNWRQFDVLLHMHSAPRAHLARLCVRATRIISLDRAKKMQSLHTKKEMAAQKKQHALDEFISLAQQLGLVKFTPQWDFPLEESALRWAKFISAGKRYVLLSASASKTERNWPAAYYSEIVRYLTQSGFAVVLTSAHDQEEVDLAKKIYIATGRRVTYLAGCTNLQELVALISQAEFVISPDAGPVHMAAMVNTPVIGIYAHRNPLYTGPWRFREYTVTHYESNILEQKGKPSSQLPWGTCAKGGHLMQRIKPSEVISKIKLILKQEFRQHFTH